MTVNGLTEAMVKERNGMGWGLGNVEVVVDPAAQKMPANRGEYGWNGSAGTYFWNDPATRNGHHPDDAVRRSAARHNSRRSCVQAGRVTAAEVRWVTFDCFGTLVDWHNGFAGDRQAAGR